MVTLTNIDQMRSRYSQTVRVGVSSTQESNPALAVVGQFGAHPESPEQGEDWALLHIKDDQIISTVADRAVPVQIRAAKSIPAPHAALVRCSATLKLHITSSTGHLSDVQINVAEDARHISEALFLAQDLQPPVLSLGLTPATATCVSPLLPSSGKASTVTAPCISLRSVDEFRADVIVQLETLLFLGPSSSVQDVQSNLRLALAAKVHEAAEALQTYIRGNQHLPRGHVKEPQARYPVVMPASSGVQSDASDDASLSVLSQATLRYWASLMKDPSPGCPAAKGKLWPDMAMHRADYGSASNVHPSSPSVLQGRRMLLQCTIVTRQSTGCISCR